MSQEAENFLATRRTSAQATQQHTGDRGPNPVLTNDHDHTDAAAGRSSARQPSKSVALSASSSAPLVSSQQPNSTNVSAGVTVPQYLDDPQFAEMFASPDEARTHAFRRVPLHISNDNVADAQSRGAEYRSRIMQALTQSDFRGPPVTKMKAKNEVALTIHEMNEWNAWQDDPATLLEHMWSLTSPLDPELINAMVQGQAWAIYNEILNIHRTGCRIMEDADMTSTCVERLEQAITCIQDFTKARLDILTLRFDVQKFAGSPSKFGETKVSNFWSNRSSSRTSGRTFSKGRTVERDGAL